MLWLPWSGPFHVKAFKFLIWHVIAPTCTEQLNVVNKGNLIYNESKFLIRQTCVWIRVHHGWEDFSIPVSLQGNSARSSRQPSLVVVKVKVRVRRWGQGWDWTPTVESPCPPKSPTWTMCRASQITWCSLISFPAAQVHRVRLHLFLVFDACRFLWFCCYHTEALWNEKF